MCTDSPQSREVGSQLNKLKGMESYFSAPTFNKAEANQNIEKWYANMFSNLATTTSEGLISAGVPMGEPKGTVMTNAVAPLAAEKLTKMTDVLKMASQNEQFRKQMLSQILGQEGNLTQLLSADTGLGTGMSFLKSITDILPMMFPGTYGLTTVLKGLGKGINSKNILDATHNFG